jgi:hypothetical protein
LLSQLPLKLSTPQGGTVNPSPLVLPLIEE